MRPLLLAFLLAAPGAAQFEFYSPEPFAFHPGANTTSYPVGMPSATKMVYQQVHGDLPLAPRPIKRFAWRQKNLGSIHAAFSASLSLTLGLGGPNPDGATSTYASNLGPNPSIVFQQIQVNFQAGTGVPAVTAPFHYEIPLPAVFLYDGSGVLCWELRVHGHTNTTSISFDMYGHGATPYVLAAGLGCSASGATGYATLAGTFSGGSLALNATNLPSGGALLLVGTSSTSLAGLALPLDLAPLGAPCALRNNMLLAAAAPVAGGSASWQAALPAAAPGGTALFMQVLGPDAKANALGLVLSNSLALIYPYAKRPVIRNWTNGSDTATSGSLQLTYGLVVRFGI